MSILPPRLTSPFASDARNQWEADPTKENALRVADREHSEASSTLAYGLTTPRKDDWQANECKWAAAAARRAQVWAAIACDAGLLEQARKMEARASRGMQSAQTGGGL